MAPSLDSALSSLLCEEDNDCISFDDYVNDDGFMGHDQNPNFKTKDGTDYYFVDYPLQNDGRLTLLTLKEHEQNVGFDLYLKRLKDQNLFLVARQQAVDWILKVNAQFNFGPLCAYLSVNYLDRFLAVYELPKDSPWMMQLLTVTCLSLAAKMEETEIPTILDLQIGESRFVFEAKTIQKMELIVLSTLKWRMQSVTPLSFIDSFIKMLNDDGQSQSQSQTNLRSLIFKSTQIIIGLIQGIDYLEYQSYEIAAAVAICVVGVEVEKIQAFTLFEHLKKERVFKCVEVVIKGCTVSFRSGTLTSLPESPIDVLEAAILSHKNDDSPTSVKRRRLNNIIL